MCRSSAPQYIFFACVACNALCVRSTENMLPTPKAAVQSKEKDGRVDGVHNEGSRDSDIAALVALYVSTDGPYRKTSWDLSAKLEKWYGVEVNGEGRVISINLGINNLRGKAYCWLQPSGAGSARHVSWGASCDRERK